MKFVDKFFTLIVDGFDKVIDLFVLLFTLLGNLFGYVIEFFKGVFYFFVKLFDIVVEIIKIFVALFQFVFALGKGLFRTIKMWLTVNPTQDVSFPSISNRGFAVVTDVLQGTGILTIVPMVALAFLWFYFVMKMIGLFGGQVMINYDRGGKD